MDPVSLLNQICDREFQIRPNFEPQEIPPTDAMSQSSKFGCRLDFGGKYVCTGYGLNKKEAKNKCATMALYKVAPNVFKDRFPEEFVRL